MKKSLPWIALFPILIAVMLARAAVEQLSAANSPQISSDIKPALDSITGNELLSHMKVLASDEYEGRAPGTKGEALTTKYLIEQFKRFGLKPGDPKGSYTQKVPLVGFTPRPSFSYTVNGKQTSLSYPEDYVARSRRLQPEVTVENSEMIFVGYGVVAPEYGWDDYKDADVRGKTVVVLNNDPQIPDARDASQLDDKMFKGRTLTYHGSRRAKCEAAAQKGAAAVLIVHDPATAPYPFKVYQDDNQTEAFEIKSPGGEKPVAVEGWLTLDAVRRLLAAVNRDLNGLKQSALNKTFKPVSLGVVAKFNVRSTQREIQSHNVVAKIEGSDQRLKDEYVIYTAHWDHLGRDEKLKGDQIYNGALDNAGGVAQMLEIAEGFARLKTPPKRSVLFIATTAEETGLLGAKYYVTNPLYPLSRTLANINLDAVNVFGRTKDVSDAGFGLTTLDEILSEAAATQNRIYIPDPFSSEGYYFRADQFEFARAGIPALFPGSALSYIGKPSNYADQKWGEYFQRGYHQVSDEVRSDWDMSGAVEDAQWLLQVGYRVAQAEKFPEWKPGAEFKARREEMLKRVKR